MFGVSKTKEIWVDGWGIDVDCEDLAQYQRADLNGTLPHDGNNINNGRHRATGDNNPKT